MQTHIYLHFFGFGDFTQAFPIEPFTGLPIGPCEAVGSPVGVVVCFLDRQCPPALLA